MLATYHNHTRYSDGKATIAEMVAAAEAAGIDELGISDHLTLAPWGPVGWSMDPARLEAYVAELDAARQRATISIRLGLEVDWFEGQAEKIVETLGDVPFDYLIGSVHFVGKFSVDGSAAGWGALSEDERTSVHRQYWWLISQLAESGLFHVVGHLDLPKKCGAFPPAVDLQSEIDSALDAIASAGMVVELNTAGWHKPCGEAYPTRDLLRRCRERGIVATLSADAHQPDHLARDFDRGLQVLEDAGYDRIARFAGGVISTEPCSISVALSQSNG